MSITLAIFAFVWFIYGIYNTREIHKAVGIICSTICTAAFVIIVFVDQTGVDVIKVQYATAKLIDRACH